MKFFLLIILFIALGNASAAEYHDRHCSIDELTVKTLPFTVTNDFSLTQEEIGRFGSGDEIGMLKSQLSVYINNCAVTIGWTYITLMVAKELRADDCAFNYILAHEQQHASTYREALERLPLAIRKRAMLGQKIREAIKEELDIVYQQQRSIDSSAAYASNMTACGGAIPRLIMRR